MKIKEWYKGVIVPMVTPLKKDGKIVETPSVEAVRAMVEIGMRIVMIVDNSFSKEERNAVKPLLSSLNESMVCIMPSNRVQSTVWVALFVCGKHLIKS